ncbi:MAG: hypothetical protein WC023_06480 [Rhodocyclaceae bacterium]
MRIELPLKTVSLLNMREHFRVAATRKALHRRTVQLMFKGKERPTLPATVTLTRLSPGTLDAHDNLPSSMKHIVDGLADWLDVDDADPRVRWVYAQQKSQRGKFGVIVEVAACGIASNAGEI